MNNLKKKIFLKKKMPSTLISESDDKKKLKSEKIKDKSDKKSKDKKDKKDKSKKEKSKEEKEKSKEKKEKSKDKSIDPEKKSKKRSSSPVEEEQVKKIKSDPALVENFNLKPCIVKALKETGVHSLFPIQIASMEPVLQGKDVLGRARTGTGKTLAFALPIVQKLHESMSNVRGRAPKALIMAPTRELAIQVYKQVQILSTDHLKVTCVYGGVPYDSQYIAFRDGVDIVVGTPGRLIDHIDRGNLKLFNLE